MGKRGNRRPSRRVKLYVEGDIEEATIRPLLGKSIRARGLDVRNTGGVGNFFRKIGKYVRNSIADGTCAVYGLIDLHNAVPGRTHLDKEDLIREVRHKAVNCVDPEFRDRFVLFLAVREYEAWALSDEENLSRFVGGKAGPWPAPEDQNGLNPPKKIINDLRLKYSRRPYRRVMDGIRLFSSIDPERVAGKCPHFREMIDKL